ncbi:MAG TPA: alpha/beta hydrolase [Sphingopyxis sp.]|nr:alpha/beta hydrolase [Sphingopyxis sp.]
MVCEGIDAAYYEGGSGPPLLLIHGSGPGASSVGNWKAVLNELARDFHVIAMDLIGFGISGRKPAPPYFDFELWVRQVRAAVDLFEGGEPVGLIGHSISGAIALRLAADHPRLGAVMTTGTMGAPMPVNPHLSKVWRCPPTRDAMRDAARTLIADEALITDAYLDARMAVIGSAEYRTYFDEMFAGDFSGYIAAAVVPQDLLARIDIPVLMLHGRADPAFPAETGSLALAAALPHADIMLFGRCSHSIAMERSGDFLAAARAHFQPGGRA